MSDLAYNINGEGFEVPETATGWRVRRMKPRGAPEVVYGRDGLPLIIPIESDLEELRRSVDAAGRFRLDAVDDRSRNIVDVPAAYVVVPHRHVDAPVALAHDTIAQRPVVGGVDAVIGEAMRLNTELAKSVIDRFPEMMQAAALLLRAADGAGLPAREGRAVFDVDSEDGEPEATQRFDLNALVAQVIPMLVMGMGNGKVKLPQLAEVIDWRKAAPAKTANPTRPDGPGDVSESATAHGATAALPPITPETMAHFIAIQSALKPEEATMAREVASNLGPAELRAWFDELTKLSVPQAVQKIRVLVAGNTEAVL